MDFERVDPRDQRKAVAVQDRAARAVHRLRPEMGIAGVLLETGMLQDLHLNQPEDEQDSQHDENRRDHA